MPGQAKAQTIEELRKRFDHLNKEKITAEANHKTAQKTLDDLKAAAKAQWATDDLDELRKKLREMEEDNERKRREYQSQLDKIESDLELVNRKFAESQEKQ